MQIYKQAKRKNILRDLSCRYTVPVIRSALISHWLNIHNFRDYPISEIYVSNSIFANSDDIPNQVHNDLKSLFKSFSLKDLETALEILLEDKLKRHTGTVLTPEFIINYLLKTSQELRQDKSGQPPTICDPACGYSGFLIPALRFLSSHFSISLLEATNRYICGFDINPESVDIAKVMLRLFLLECGFDPKDILFNIYCVDSLLEKPEDIKRRIHNSKGFDIIVTNPPYIKLQNLTPDYRECLLHNYPEFAVGSFSAAMLFLVAGYRLLSADGCLGYITQNNLFTSLAGTEVRRFLSEKKCIKRIIDFGHAKLFANASAYTCLIFISQKPTERFEYGRLSSNIDAQKLSSIRLSTISHSILNPSKWRLITEEHTKNIRKIETQGVPLGSLCKLRVGFATLKDKAYFVYCNDNRLNAEGPDGKIIEIESDITRPAIKIAEFDHENDLLNNHRRIIFPYEKVNGKYNIINEEIFFSKFPRCYEYLLLWKRALALRDKGLRKNETWYAWGRTQSMDAPGPKLLTKTFSDHPNFLYDSTDSLFCNGYAVFPKMQQALLFEPKYSLKVIQIILNSVIMDYYIRLTSIQIEGNYQCYQKNFIERFSVPILSDKQQEFLLDTVREKRDQLLCEMYSIDYENIVNFLAESKNKFN